MDTKQSKRALPAGTRLEQYTVVRSLSSGGFSEVYLALDQHDRKYAIKEYLPLAMTSRRDSYNVTVLNELDRDAFKLGLKCFFEEARILAGIQHPNIVRVGNFFRANQTVYMVMDYTEGRPLAKEIELSPHGIAEQRLRRLFAELIGGLREVHLQHLLHLDIKPANIYLRRNGTPVLLDFGAARQTLGRAQQLGSMFTPGYAAPEQYEVQGKLGPWTDIYALGACMYVAMGGDKLQSADLRLKQDKVVPASKAFARYYSPELLALVDDCLCLDPLTRLASLSEMQKRLRDKHYTTPTPPRGIAAWFGRLMGRKA